MAVACVLGALLLLGCARSFAADGAKPFATCTACHGNQGQGNPALGAPAIAGQDAAYLERQLRNFRSGLRGTHASDAPGARMRAIAMTLDDAALAQAATLASRLSRPPRAAAAGGDLHNGNNLYQGKCAACHGTLAEGNAALKAPRLAGLDAVYIQRQFAHFRDGVRGTQPQDVPGRQMAMMAKTLATRDLDDVIAFIQQQGRTQ